MPGFRVESVFAKLDRASEHGHTLQREIKAWVDAGPYTFAFDVNGDGTRWAVRVESFRRPDLQRWALIVGDALHNIRSALDHLFFAVAERYAPGVAIEQRRFPVVRQSRRFSEFKGRSKTLESLIPVRVWTAIEREQSYKRRDWSAPHAVELLDLLNALDVADKHHGLHLVTVRQQPRHFGLVYKPRGVSVDIRTNPDFWEGRSNGEDRAEIASFTFSAPGGDVHHNLEFTTLVTLNERRPFEVTTLIAALVADVTGVVERVSAVVE